eukprot:gnl/Hemi2/20577_TR6829_c0_g1_i1.p1 gnl/Hemi2/20577_TR6829_c0_g1~~gnl/Hemi2/20577_TR6829_c0_g1_i1.p1  ORF type:complete len:164 (+),score=54.45 gnl/Hemi2/20577_TR6829_c0_g1_i1:143-634(+)
MSIGPIGYCPSLINRVVTKRFSKELFERFHSFHLNTPLHGGGSAARHLLDMFENREDFQDLQNYCTVTFRKSWDRDSRSHVFVKWPMGPIDKVDIHNMDLNVFAVLMEQRFEQLHADYWMKHNVFWDEIEEAIDEIGGVAKTEDEEIPEWANIWDDDDDEDES